MGIHLDFYFKEQQVEHIWYKAPDSEHSYQRHVVEV